MIILSTFHWEYVKFKFSIKLKILTMKFNIAKYKSIQIKLSKIFMK